MLMSFGSMCEVIGQTPSLFAMDASWWLHTVAEATLHSIA